MLGSLGQRRGCRRRTSPSTRRPSVNFRLPSTRVPCGDQALDRWLGFLAEHPMAPRRSCWLTSNAQLDALHRPGGRPFHHFGGNVLYHGLLGQVDHALQPAVLPELQGLGAAGQMPWSRACRPACPTSVSSELAAEFGRVAARGWITSTCHLSWLPPSSFGLQRHGWPGLRCRRPACSFSKKPRSSRSARFSASSWRTCAASRSCAARSAVIRLSEVLRTDCAWSRSCRRRSTSARSCASSSLASPVQAGQVLAQLEGPQADGAAEAQHHRRHHPAQRPGHGAAHRRRAVR